MKKLQAGVIAALHVALFAAACTEVGEDEEIRVSDPADDGEVEPAPEPDTGPDPRGVAYVTAPAIPTGYTKVTVNCGAQGDDTAVLQGKLNNLKSYQALVLPATTCTISKSLKLSNKTNVAVIGAGMDASILQATNPLDGSFETVAGDGVLLGGFQVYSPASTKRQSTPPTTCFAFLQSTKNLTIDGLKGRRCASGGFLFAHVTNTVVKNSVVDHSLADAFHVAYGSSNVTIQNSKAINPGDDMFASIGYAGLNKNITFTDNEGWGGNWGGGVSFESTDGGYAARNKIHTTGVSCFRAASWDSYQEQATTNIVIEDNYGEDCVTRSVTGHASIMLFTNISDVTGITVRNNTIENPSSGAAVRAFGYNGAIVNATVKDNTFIHVNKCWNIGYNATLTRSGNTLDGNGC